MHSWRSARTFKLCSRLLIVRSSLSQAHRQPEAAACRRLPATPSSPPFPLPQSPMLGAIRPAHAKAPRKVHTRDLIQLQHMARRQMACGQQRDQKGRDRNEHLTRTGLLTSSFVSSILAGHFVLFTRPAALSTNRATNAPIDLLHHQATRWRNKTVKTNRAACQRRRNRKRPAALPRLASEEADA